MMVGMRFSNTELSAMLLDGEIIRLGDRHVHARTAISPQLRIACIDIPHDRQNVISHRLAAWVHGCGGFPDDLDLTIQTHHRQRIPSDPRVRVRRFRLDFRYDTQLIAGVRVTDPVRTALHLLGEADADAAALTSAALLAGGIDALSEHVEHAARIRASDRSRMRTRLQELQPLVTL